jgi:hypothetical protein
MNEIEKDLNHSFFFVRQRILLHKKIFRYYFKLYSNYNVDFYNITEIADKTNRILDRTLERIIVKRVFKIHQLAHFLIIDLEKEIIKKYNSKLLDITGDFFLSDPQISK